jgi:hypothetical protein
MLNISKKCVQPLTRKLQSFLAKLISYLMETAKNAITNNYAEFPKGE